MFDIQLEINNYPLKLGMITSDCRNYLGDKRTSKVGFLSKFLMRRIALADRNGIFYFNKNCRIDVFNRKLTIVPNLTAAIDADEMYATSGYVNLKEKLINKIYIQVINNKEYAAYFFDEFRAICRKIYGLGKCKENSKIVIELWEEDESTLKVGWLPKYGNMFFELGIKSIIKILRSLEGIELGTMINVFENNSKWKEVFNHSFSDQRVFQMYSGGKQFVCHCEFNRLHLIGLTTFVAQTDFYLKQFTEKYGIPNRPKRNEYLWTDDSTGLLLVKRRELSILMEDKNK